MNKLFLTSSFSSVASFLPEFVGSDLKGKTVTFIPTASLPEKVTFYVKSGFKALEKLGMRIEILDIAEAAAPDAERILTENDFIYVSGGNSFFLLQELHRKNLGRVMTELIQNGKIYIGESAGSIIMSPSIGYIIDMDDAAAAPDLQSAKGLGLVPFYPLPHLGNFPFQKTVKKIIDEYGERLDLVSFSNSQAICVDGDGFTIKSR